MTLQELGQSIREKREAAGLTIDDVAARIKISTRILKSIEEGSLVGLPHAVYTKSFIRSFGLLVGYAPEELNASLELLFPPESLDETRAEPPYRIQVPMSYPSAGRRFAVLLVMLLILTALIGGGWYVTVTYGEAILELVKKPFSAISAPVEGNGQGTEKTSTNGAAATSEVLSNTLSALVGSSVNQQARPAAVPKPAPPSASLPVLVPPSAGGAGSPAPQTDAPAAESPASAGVAASGAEKRVREMPQVANAPVEDPVQSPDSSSPPRTNGNSEAGTAAPPSSERPGGALAPGGKNQVLLTAQEACWVGPRADGSKGRDFTLQPGESFVLTYTNTLELTLGNAGGVTLEHNGQKQGNPGKRGQRMVLRFPSLSR